ncbi:hypothetical protein BATDEDRAFT_89895 [Batrachochytrium dendrobatidis JAM81]|uniref:Enhancer of rudimentary homolog n=1 Tax=Batrachochytrium dendrobatidis (strain JAM81 / FGSC 10211) TaxID=684364 RepID=F4P5R0_BATDJ|nr:uncharacterized protein BATDEDRAFT_89895 [Batrachochytrium dendrobatidis JAM81]EGF79229.1 hypothetical protein BATDEDRAFT_89895 [Batrachochytrium dendrobatidis JAM81]KAJ8322781.1 hypothetical protein O5D80_008312 [Batrachochytrium dendrobatidis]|eukprot:XP_006680065.1 hypothetical protein BATDEDRAFT_89895 [Batrachochytrium dendrobatidis JAM81]
MERQTRSWVEQGMKGTLKKDQHTILLLQAETTQRVWADFSTVEQAMEELISYFEHSLKEKAPNKLTLKYQIADFNRYIDTTPDIGCLVFDHETKSYVPHDKTWIKKQVFTMLRGIVVNK